jgi:hypothetical protein
MRWYVMHVHDAAGDDPREEAYVYVPGIAKTVFPVPIDGLAAAFAAFDQALEELGDAQRCAACDAVLPDPAAAEQFSGRG